MLRTVLTSLIPSVLLVLCVTPRADAQTELKNDNLSDGGTAIVQGGFVEGETGAAVLSASAGQYPVTLQQLQVFVDKQPGVAFTSMTVELYVWDTSTISGSSPSLGSAVYVSPELTFTAGFFNAWDVVGENLVMTGPFTVGCRVIDTNFISIFQGNQPNMVTDNNGCQGGKNYVRQTNGVWANLCAFGVSGDLAIRCLVTTGGGGGGQFINLGSGLAGNFAPTLGGTGSLAGGGSFTLALAGLPGFTTTSLVVGFTPLFAPFKGGVLGPSADLILPLATGTGALNLPSSMPPGLPSAFIMYLQSWTPDPGRRWAGRSRRHERPAADHAVVHGGS
ncbi:MAG: hypothetical protein ACYTG2_14610 [Planctomycetota bacterium]|jgi:hypothetical protein